MKKKSSFLETFKARFDAKQQESDRLMEKIRELSKVKGDLQKESRDKQERNQKLQAEIEELQLSLAKLQRKEQLR